jgi:hypothetical protein
MTNHSPPSKSSWLDSPTTDLEQIPTIRPETVTVSANLDTDLKRLARELAKVRPDRLTRIAEALTQDPAGRSLQQLRTRLSDPQAIFLLDHIHAVAGDAGGAALMPLLYPQPTNMDNNPLRPLASRNTLRRIISEPRLKALLSGCQEIKQEIKQASKHEPIGASA